MDVRFGWVIVAMDEPTIDDEPSVDMWNKKKDLKETEEKDRKEKSQLDTMSR